MERMLTLDPSRRITAMDALEADYFFMEPLAAEPHTLPIFESSHEYNSRTAIERREARRRDELSRSSSLQFADTRSEVDHSRGHHHRRDHNHRRY